MAALAAAAADIMVEARSISCYGLRSSFPTAYLLYYVASILGSPTVLVEECAERLTMCTRLSIQETLYWRLQFARRRYTVHAELAVSRGAKLVALTESELSPIGKLAAVVIRVRTEMPSLFHTTTPSLAAAECLVELITVQRGSRTLEALEANEAHLAAFDPHVVQRPRRREL